MQRLGSFESELYYSPHDGGGNWREYGLKKEPSAEYREGDLAGAYHIPIFLPDRRGRERQTYAGLVVHRNPSLPAEREGRPFVVAVNATGFGCTALQYESYFSVLVKKLQVLNPNILAFDYIHPGMLKPQLRESPPFAPYVKEAPELYSLLQQPAAFEQSLHYIFSELVDVESVDAVLATGNSMGTLPVIYGSRMLNKIGILEDKVVRSVTGSIVQGLGPDADVARFIDPLRSHLHRNVSKLPFGISDMVFSSFIHATHPGWRRLLHLPNEAYFRKSVATVNPDVLAVHIEDLLQNMEEILGTLSSQEKAPIDNIFWGKSDALANIEGLKVWSQELKKAAERGVHVIELDGDHVPERNPLQASRMARHMVPLHLR